MNTDQFLGIMWDYYDWVAKKDRELIERKIRLELNEWEKAGLIGIKSLLEEILKEVELDLKEL